MKIDAHIPLSEIRKDSNIRDENIDIDDLMSSIEAHGLLQPIIVSPFNGNDFKYKIVAGHRRFLACQKLEHETIPAVIKKFKNPQIIQLTENIQRSNLSKIEESKVIYELKKKLDCSVADIMRHLGKNHKWAISRISFHEVREFLIKSETLPIKSINMLTFDISRMMYSHPKKHWLKMAAESLGKKWYPDDLKDTFNSVADPEYIQKPRNPSKTKGSDFKEKLMNDLNDENFGDFSIHADDSQSIMKLMFVDDLAYKKMLDVLQEVGGEII